MRQKGFLNIIIAIIVGAVVILGGAYVIVNRPGQPVTPEPKSADQQSPAKQSSQQTIVSNTTSPVAITANKTPLFGTMLAFNINDAMMSAPGTTDTLRQKGWTEFRKDNAAYQNLLGNLKKLIQDRIKLVSLWSLPRGLCRKVRKPSVV